MKLAIIFTLLREQWRHVALKNGAALYRMSWCGAAVSTSLLAALCCRSLWPWYVVTAILAVTFIPLAAFLWWITWPYIQNRILRSGNKFMAILCLGDEYIEESRLRNPLGSSPSKPKSTLDELEFQTHAFQAQILSETYPSFRDLLTRSHQPLHPLGHGLLVFDKTSTETTITFTCTIATRSILP